MNEKMKEFAELAGIQELYGVITDYLALNVQGKQAVIDYLNENRQQEMIKALMQADWLTS